MLGQASQVEAETLLQAILVPRVSNPTCYIHPYLYLVISQSPRLMMWPWTSEHKDVHRGSLGRRPEFESWFNHSFTL